MKLKRGSTNGSTGSNGIKSILPFKLLSSLKPKANPNPSLKPLDIKLYVAGDLLNSELSNGETSLKNFILNIYTSQTTVFDYIPSLFADCEVDKALCGQAVKFSLSTSAGHEELDRVRPLNYPRTSVVLLVFHYNSKASFNNALNKWYPEIKHHLPKVPVVLVGVKDDFIPKPLVAGIKEEEVKARAQEKGIDLFMECSVSNLDSINNVFNQAMICALFSQKETKQLGVSVYHNQRGKIPYNDFPFVYFNTFGLKSLAHQLRWSPVFVEGVKELTDLTADPQLCIARYLSPSDWSSLRQTCKSLNKVYKSNAFWNSNFVPLYFLDAYTRQHPEFQRYHFVPKSRLALLFSKHQRLYKKIFRWGVDPWQIAILMGLVEQVKAVHGEEAMKKLQDENGYGVVHYLILGEYTEAVIQWLKSTGFKAEQDPDYRLPALAVMTGNVELLPRLVKEFGYQLTVSNKTNFLSLLHLAVEYGQSDMIAWLNKQGISPVEVSRLGSDPKSANLALLAADRGNWGVFENLLACGVDPYDTPEHQRFVALAAIRTKNKTLATTLIKRYSLDTQAGRYTEDSFFYAAILSGDPETLHFAIQQGWGALTDCYQCTPREAKPPLSKTIFHVMAEAGLVDLIERVIDQKVVGLSINKTDGDGNTALHYAAMHGNPTKLKRLLQKHFSPKDLLSLNSQDETIAQVAARFGHTECVFQLYLICQSYRLDAKAFFSRQDKDQCTLLHKAMQGGAVKLAIWLVRELQFSTTALTAQQHIPLRRLAEMASLNPEYRIHFANVLRVMLRDNLMPIQCLTEYPDAGNITIDDLMLREGTKDFYEILCEELISLINTAPKLTN